MKRHEKKIYKYNINKAANQQLCQTRGGSKLWICGGGGQVLCRRAKNKVRLTYAASKTISYRLHIRAGQPYSTFSQDVCLPWIFPDVYSGCPDQTSWLQTVAGLFLYGKKNTMNAESVETQYGINLKGRQMPKKGQRAHKAHIKKQKKPTINRDFRLFFLKKRKSLPISKKSQGYLSSC